LSRYAILFALVITFDAILPAGGQIDAEFAAKVGTSSKALIKFGEQTILERTIVALKETGRVGRIVVSGTEEVRNSPAAKLATKAVASGNSGPESILNALKGLLEEPNPPKKVVVLTTDLPFLTPKLLTDFIDSCPKDVDICMPLITRSQYQARFPHSSSTFIPLNDDTWTAGNTYLMDVNALQKAMPHLEKVFKVRKSKIGMAKLLGPVFLYKFLRKQLTVPLVEAKLKQILGCSGAPVLNCAPELAYDIDDFEDYEYAMRFIGGEFANVSA
jgi:GTP:adenosylcobinamide-phosphate guanylyltransferase